MNADETVQQSDQPARDTITHDLRRNLFVEAGAGTGKTTQLVGRIKQLVLTDDPARRVPLAAISAITFTEAAAAELRERVRAEFETEKRAAELDGRDDIVELCTVALHDADMAAISTLHAFAQRLLSEFPVEVGIPPRVEVVDEVQSQVAFDDRWSEFVDHLYDDRSVEEFIVRASLLGVGLGSSGTSFRTIAKTFDDNWDRLVGIDSFEPAPLSIPWQSIAARVRTVVDATAWCSDADDKALAKVGELESFLAAGEGVEQLRALLRLCSVTCSNGRNANWDGRLAEFKELFKAATEHAERLRDEIAGQTLTLVSARIAKFTIDSANERRGEGRLEFHDLLVLARMLLRTSEEARNALSQRYRVLMLDEFQDTDPIQIELALLLAGAVSGRFDGDWHELEPDPGRVFMVGDPKQSIYRFRRADIDLFLAARSKFSDGVVELNRNYRTVAPILAAVNALFGDLMPADVPGQAEYRPLVAHREPSAGIDHRPVLLGGGADLTAHALREREAADVAAVIQDVRTNPDRWPVSDAAGGWRPPTLRDVTILVPTRTSVGQLTEALEQRDIPYRADTGVLVYETQEVRDLLSVLRSVDDPSDQISLVAALRSPLYGCGDDDLLRWREAGGAWDYTRPCPDGCEDGVVALAMTHLSSLARRRWWDEPSRLLMRLVDERGAFALGVAAPRPRDTWRRIRYVIDQARAFEEAEGGDLRSYLRWTRLQGFDGSKAHEPMLPEADDDAVQIMTIHGSKGLEFPITIVSGLTTQFSRGRSGVAVNWREPGSLPEVKVRKGLRTPHFDVTADFEAEMDGLEKQRLLYVGLTRARDHLVVSAHHKRVADKKPPRSHGLTVSDSFSRPETAHLVRQFDAVEQPQLFPLGTEPSPFAQLDSADTVGADSYEADQPEAWERRRGQVIAAAAAPNVVSATALAQQVRDEIAAEDDEPWAGDHHESLPPQTFRRGRAGTAIGSAVHGVLQLIDLSDPDRSDIARLAESQAWAESVPEHAATIEASVRAALEADVVRSCRSARHWKELYVAAPVGDVAVEGYVDLLVEHPDGLVVVDYKTDAVSSENELADKLAGYALQGAAYAVAVESATGRQVTDVQFVFTGPDGAVVRSPEDLDSLRNEVRRRAAATRG